jgi:CheY-like chemotaxis protein
LVGEKNNNYHLHKKFTGSMNNFTSLSLLMVYTHSQREGFSHTAPAVKPQHFHSFAEAGSQPMSAGTNRDAAQYTLPGGGSSTLSETTMSGTHGIAQRPLASHLYAERPPTLRQILLVDDDASLARLEAGMLSARGYEVAVATSGELAISAIHQAIPDLVLLDLDLSGSVTGWDVFKALRSLSRTPVLLTSAESAARRHMRTQGESRSTLDHLPKPYPMQALLRRIERMLAMEP